MVICFHGTDKATAELILKDGFKKRTCFARHLEDALEFGGGYVFYVRFEDNYFDRFDPDWWQFRLSEHLAPDTIWRLQTYRPELLFDNQDVVENKS